MLSTDRIKPLPPEAVAKIKSSTSVTNLNDVIVELVKNALDANARTVFVTVDFQRGGCVVDDDGDGIPPGEFEAHGGLMKAHHTSRFDASKMVYGHRGLFLASLSSLSLLTVTSRNVRHSTTNTVVFHHATPVARLCPAPAQREPRFGAHGTSVTVNDLFGNMPVRVKNRALTLQKPDELERQWDELKQALVSLMVANDRLNRLVVSDAGKERKLTIRPRATNEPADGGLDRLRVSSILAQAGLIDSPDASHWDTVSACVPDLAIYAAISLVPSPSKRVQFISIGIDPLQQRNNANILYGEVNRIFSLSDFGTGSNLSSGSREFSSRVGLYAKSAAKSVSKWPVFCIRIYTTDPQRINGDGQEGPEPEKSIQRIIDVLGAMVNEFLKQHNLRPRATKGSGNETQLQMAVENGDKPSPHSRGKQGTTSSTEEALGGQVKLPSFKRRAPIISQHFGDWSRIKSARDISEMCSPRLKHHTPSPTDPAIHQRLKRRSPERASYFPQTPQTVGESDPGVDDKGTDTDTAVTWTDPLTGRSHLINPRTGQSIAPQSPMDVVLRRPQSTSSFRSMRMSDSITRPRSAILNETENKWVENLLENWDNPAFGRAERPISAIDIGAAHADVSGLEAKCRDLSGEMCELQKFGLSKFRGKLSRQDLERAEIVAQVDRKFILVKLGTAPGGHDHDVAGSVLVLIDQHAADERCRVEALFERFLEWDSRRIDTVALEPIVFETPSTELALLKRYAGFFNSWGVGYTVEQGPEDRRAFVSVNTLPRLIAERCRVEPILVTDLIRGEIWRREENGGRPTTVAAKVRPSDTSEENTWVRRLDGCPQGIIELVNSRACRTAIMFNDVLNTSECQSLVRRLARCVFPFQCAHGRPSMIPVVMTGMGDAEEDHWGDTSGEEGVGVDFVDAFRRWRSRIDLSD
ncbi:hypothetical protein P168DRAFT_240632 [Aspergillus campestris IBT 28561]|uniref:MutL C-terminal dimerisation domain-containing protein n=1 Tax=Aspergillus campestris (strain IBT 28561) TaxID=1392248 RepID=A0A2I1CWB8_ASPC2|nr:uncharacterized protein P168DRAFT_240632 [Aspergillus campestris IBT 28561]PKY01915.1 hypothetical protein P168DRAFT_240632 [Aspergillus campestris IBT 28561]